MIAFKQTNLPKAVPKEIMERVYASIKTPVKHGAVIKFQNDWTDSPSVFHYGKMFMLTSHGLYVIMELTITSIVLLISKMNVLLLWHIHKDINRFTMMCEFQKNIFTSQESVKKRDLPQPQPRYRRHDTTEEDESAF